MLENVVFIRKSVTDPPHRCTYKTSQDITPQDKTSQDKTSQVQNVPRDKTTQGTKRPKGQNVLRTKRPKGQNVLRTKRPKGTNEAHYLICVANYIIQKDQDKGFT